MYEIHTYDRQGRMVSCRFFDTVEECFLALAKYVNAVPNGNFPTVWKDGQRIR